jgi:hypothetical protein
VYFGNALIHLKGQYRLSRTAWSGNAWIFLERDGDNGPRIFARTSLGVLEIWTPTHADLLATDWYVVEWGPRQPTNPTETT